MPPSPALDHCTLFLVRHGATENNLADPPRLQGQRADVGLSDEGRQQAAQTARLLATQPLAAVFSSPLRRAVETAEQIAGPHRLLVEPVEALKEVDVGRWENRTWVEISQAEPDAYRRFLDDPATFGYPEGENHTQVFERVAPAMEQLMDAHLGKKIVVVGHNVVGRVFLAGLLGVPLSGARRVSHSNGGISVLQRRGGQTTLLTLNSTFHLKS